MRDNNVINLHDDGSESNWLLDDAREQIDNAFAPASAEIDQNPEIATDSHASVVDIQAYQEAARDTSLASAVEVTKPVEAPYSGPEVANLAFMVADTLLPLRDSAVSSELIRQDTRQFVVRSSQEFKDAA